MKKLRLAAAAFAVAIGLFAAVPFGQTAGASPADIVQQGVNKVGGNTTGANASFGSIVAKIIKVMLYILGALSVVMIIFGGFKYVTSRGESADVTSAKNTILYAVVGLIVALLAYAIVSFVVKEFQPGTTSNTTQQAPRGVGPTP